MYLVILFFNNQFLVLSIIFRNFNRCLLGMMKEEGFNVSYDITIFMWTKETVFEGSDINNCQVINLFSQITAKCDILAKRHTKKT